MKSNKHPLVVNISSCNLPDFCFTHWIWRHVTLYSSSFWFKRLPVRSLCSSSELFFDVGSHVYRLWIKKNKIKVTVATVVSPSGFRSLISKAWVENFSRRHLVFLKFDVTIEGWVWMWNRAHCILMQKPQPNSYTPFSSILLKLDYKFKKGHYFESNMTLN